MLIRVLALRARSPGCRHNELYREKAEGNGGAEGEKREKWGVKEGALSEPTMQKSHSKMNILPFVVFKTTFEKHGKKKYLKPIHFPCYPK